MSEVLSMLALFTFLPETAVHIILRKLMACESFLMIYICNCNSILGFCKLQLDTPILNFSVPYPDLQINLISLRYPAMVPAGIDILEGSIIVPQN